MDTILDSPFPISWDEWRVQWDRFTGTSLFEDLFKPTDYKFPPANAMADEVLGAWDVLGRAVELSEVTMFGTRFVGVTVERDDAFICRNWRQLFEGLNI